MTEDLRSSLYLEIAEAMRQLIATGEWKPGDRLPPVRELARQWSCTPGTVSRAYARLAQEGLIVARGGAGTRVASNALQPALPPAWRWAALVHRAEELLLYALSSGHDPGQAETALSVAIARWRQLRIPAAFPTPSGGPTTHPLRFVGSHDLVVELLPRLLAETAHDSRLPRVTLTQEYVGSLGGLMALARDQADLAGIHLWDAESGTYNVPFVLRVLPNRPAVLLALAYRLMGVIVPSGNPARIQAVADLGRPGVQFVNRQPGSGTRVWLEGQLRSLGMDPTAISGYERIEPTHLGVARAIAQGEANAGLGILSAANAYGLDFVPLAQERYDLVFLKEVFDTQPVQALVAVVRSEPFHEALLDLGGYDSSITGQELHVG